ncbi:hypothetical protein BKA70DRAFT_1050789, partial [Coprinopsis sp. MPI-PUGE-AT-0042]
YMISFSHTCTRYAFIWKCLEKNSTAFYQIGGDTSSRAPVGQSWAAASSVHLGANSVVTENVTSALQAALPRNEETAAFIIPNSV